MTLWKVAAASWASVTSITAVILLRTLSNPHPLQLAIMSLLVVCVLVALPECTRRGTVVPATMAFGLIAASYPMYQSPEQIAQLVLGAFAYGVTMLWRMQEEDTRRVAHDALV